MTTDAPQGIAHHGEPILTQDMAKVCLAMLEWIRVVEAEYARRGDKAYLPKRFTPSYVDLIKSRLFWRLRSGKEALPEAPPTAYSCPWYEVVENDHPHWAYECFFGDEIKWKGYDGCAIIAQCPYKIVEKREADWVVQFNCYKFRLWKGTDKVPSIAPDSVDGKREIEGWFLQRIK